MKQAIHPRKMTLDHSVLREVIGYLYHKQAGVYLPQRFSGKLTIWYVVDQAVGEQIEVRCELTDSVYVYNTSMCWLGEEETLSRFNDHVLINALKAMQWRSVPKLVAV